MKKMGFIQNISNTCVKSHLFTQKWSKISNSKSQFFFIMFVSLDMFFESTLTLFKRWFLELSPLPLLFSPPFRGHPTTRHQQEEGHNTCPLKPDFLGMAKEIQRRPFLRREPWCDRSFFMCYTNPYSMRNSISWGFLWCDGGPEFFGNMMWFWEYHGCMPCSKNMASSSPSSTAPSGHPTSTACVTDVTVDSMAPTVIGSAVWSLH